MIVKTNKTTDFLFHLDIEEQYQHELKIYTWTKSLPNRTSIRNIGILVYPGVLGDPSKPNHFSLVERYKA